MPEQDGRRLRRRHHRPEQADSRCRQTHAKHAFDEARQQMGGGNGRKELCEVRLQVPSRRRTMCDAGLPDNADGAKPDLNIRKGVGVARPAPFLSACF